MSRFLQRVKALLGGQAAAECPTLPPPSTATEKPEPASTFPHHVDYPICRSRAPWRESGPFFGPPYHHGPFGL